MFALAFVLAAAGCQRPNDTSPPEVELRGGGLGNRSITLTGASTEPVRRGASSNDPVGFSVKGTDRESGVRQVRLSGNIDVICIPATGNRIVKLGDPIGEIANSPNTSSPEGILTHNFRVDIAKQRARCPANTTFNELTIEVRAIAENGDGLTQQTPQALVNSFGPDILSVATFNVGERHVLTDAVFERYGRELGSKADVLLLTELPHRRAAELIARTADLPHLEVLRDNDTDLAIASKGPIRNVVRRTINLTGGLESNTSKILMAKTELRGHPFQVVATHWGIRYNDKQVSSSETSPGRVEAATAIRDMLDPPPAVAFVGGDLNAYSGIGPQADGPGSTEEVRLLSASMVDTFAALNGGAGHCSDNRVDYVFVRSPYHWPFRYQGNFCVEDEPSDHPFVLVTFVLG